LIGLNNKKFNYNTLEPKILKENGNDIKLFNEIFGTSYEDINDMHKYMRSNKTKCALDIFEADKIIKYPKYILDSIK
jgi:putative ATP-dependent endonuclease of OLD family